MQLVVGTRCNFLLGADDEPAHGGGVAC
jgi:hypothetical protein